MATARKMATGGPKTARGKAVVAQNAVTHGAMSLTVPPAEREAYASHLVGVVASLAPVGYLEERLAERVALTLWRMRRLDRWEAASLDANWAVPVGKLVHGTGLHGAVPSEATLKANMNRPVEVLSLHELRLDLACHMPDGKLGNALNDLPELERQGEEMCRDGEALSNLPDEPTAKDLGKLGGGNREVILDALVALLRSRGLEDEDIAHGALRRKPTDEEVESVEFLELSPKQLEGLWRLCAQHDTANDGDETTASVVRVQAYVMLRRGHRITELVRRARELVSREQASMLVLEEQNQAKFHRYESHLERTLYKALHELEAMQEKRRGGVAPLARVEVHGE